MEIDDAHALLRSCLGGAPRSDPDDPGNVLAMQIALNLPRTDPPAREAVLADAARAVVTLCLRPDDEWVAALQHWYGGKIRKVARRSRNAAWSAVQDFPGVTVENARAFVPGKVGEVPPAIRKLQVKGTDLPRVINAAGPHVGRGEGLCPALIVNGALEMTLGKAAAQVGHASMLLAAHRPIEWVRDWSAADFPVVVREVTGDQFGRWARKDGAVFVVDAGYTEVAPGSTTVIAVDS